MKTVIELENMFFRACHGCYELEKIVGNNFEVSLTITADLTVAAMNDDLRASINYLEAYNVVAREMEKTSDILENVAYRVASSIKNTFKQAESVTARVSKLAPPLGGKIEKVSVTVTL